MKNCVIITHGAVCREDNTTPIPASGCTVYMCVHVFDVGFAEELVCARVRNLIRPSIRPSFHPSASEMMDAFSEYTQFVL